MMQETLLAAAIAAYLPGAAATTQPAAPKTDPAAVKILNELEATEGEYTTIYADVDFEVLDRMTGDRESRTGWVAYSRQTAAAPARFRVTFDTLRQGSGRKIAARVDYAFDGTKLTIAKHRIKQLTRMQVAEKGQRFEPLKLGKGPFPVPFGQKAEDVLKYFDVTARPARASEPKDTDYLKLVTKEQFAKEIQFIYLEMWVDRKLHLPVRIVSRDRHKKITRVAFRNVSPNKTLKAAIFTLPRPSGWKVIDRPLK